MYKISLTGTDDKTSDTFSITIGDTKDKTVETVTKVFGKPEIEDDMLHIGDLCVYFDEEDKVKVVSSDVRYFETVDIIGQDGGEGYPVDVAVNNIADNLGLTVSTLICCENNDSKWIDIDKGIRLNGDIAKCSHNMCLDDCEDCIRNIGCTSYIVDNVRDKYDVMYNVFGHGYHEIYISTAGEVRKNNN